MTVTVRTASGVAPVAWDPVSLRRQTLPELGRGAGGATG